LNGSDQNIGFPLATENSRNALHFGLGVIRALRGDFVRYTLMALAFALTSLLPAQLLHFFTVEIQGPPHGPFLNQLAIFGICIAICLSLSSFGKVYLKEWLQLKVEVYLRRRLIEHFHHLPLEALEGAQRGDWLTRISGDVKVTEDFLGNTLPDMLFSLLLVLGTTVILLQYSGFTVLLPVLVALAIAFFNFRIQKKLRPLLEEMRTLYSGLFQILIENLEGWKTIRSYDCEGYETERVQLKLQGFVKKGKVSARLIGLTLSSNDFITQILIAGCLVALGFGVASGKLKPESALFYPFYLGQFFFAVSSLVMGANAWTRYVANGGRLAQLFSLPLSPEPPSLMPFPRPSEENEQTTRLEVKVRDLFVGFEQRPPLISGLNLNFSKGQLCALTGPSGSGKSTLL
jgi:ABC-type multidrug transport system fused ATPase/permease subunit